MMPERPLRARRSPAYRIAVGGVHARACIVCGVFYLQARCVTRVLTKNKATGATGASARAMPFLRD